MCTYIHVLYCTVDVHVLVLWKFVRWIVLFSWDVCAVSLLNVWSLLTLPPGIAHLQWIIIIIIYIYIYIFIQFRHVSSVSRDTSCSDWLTVLSKLFHNAITVSQVRDIVMLNNGDMFRHTLPSSMDFSALQYSSAMVYACMFFISLLLLYILLWFNW
jgi:hypothetical protein